MNKLIIILLILSSCTSRVDKIEKKHMIILAKEKVWNDGDTEHRIAFTDGSDYGVSFGVYSKYEIGDTIWFEGIDGESLYYWEIIDKN